MPARELLSTKTNVRVLEVPLEQARTQLDFKRIGGGLLVQTPDTLNVTSFRVSRSLPSNSLHRRSSTDLLFAWRVAKFVKSNAIVFCNDGRRSA